MAYLMAVQHSSFETSAVQEILAEGEGFEPSIRNFRMPPFQGGTINHSASFHDVLGCELQRRGEGFSAGWAGARNREAGIYQRTKGLSRVTE